MQRLLRAVGFRRDRRREPEPLPITPEQRPSQTISPDMARKLFGEPEPTLPPPEHDTQAQIEAKPPTDKYVRYVAPTPPPRVNPFDKVKAVAQAEPRFKALLEATSGKERLELAKAIPELKAPHPYLSELENQMLTLVYLEGGAYTAVGRQQQLNPALAKQIARTALYYVAFYEAYPERADERIPKCFNPDFAQFIRANGIEEKRLTAKRHPELKALLKVLGEREAQVLHELYWEDMTLAEIGLQLGLTRQAVRQIANKAVRKLNFDDRCKLQRRDDEANREHLIYALQRHPTLSEAARALKLSPQEVLARLKRLEIAPSVASPERTLSDSPRVEALREATLPHARKRVAETYPELRPPHVFLNLSENTVLEHLYWQGLSYQDTQRDLLWPLTTRIKESEASALEKMAYYLRHQPIAYYRHELPS